MDSSQWGVQEKLRIIDVNRLWSSQGLLITFYEAVMTLLHLYAYFSIRGRFEKRQRGPTPYPTHCRKL